MRCLCNPIVGDEYDSGDEVKRTKADDAFIDNDDDLDDVLDEYGNDKQVPSCRCNAPRYPMHAQEFHDERPDMDDDEDEAPQRQQRELDFFDETMKGLKSGRAKSKMSLSQQDMENITQVPTSSSSSFFSPAQD